MAPTSDIEKALAELREQDLPNFTEVSRKYDFHRTTLSRRYYGQTTSRDDPTNIYNRCLAKHEEDALVGLINRLTKKRLPPTPQIVKNLVEEMRGSTVGKNWVGKFVKRCRNELKSIYLCRIDNKCIKSEYRPTYQLFYNLVELLSTLLLL